VRSASDNGSDEIAIQGKVNTAGDSYALGAIRNDKAQLVSIRSTPCPYIASTGRRVISFRS
jgi:hypothetical protein